MAASLASVFFFFGGGVYVFFLFVCLFNVIFFTLAPYSASPCLCTSGTTAKTLSVAFARCSAILGWLTAPYCRLPVDTALLAGQHGY